MKHFLNSFILFAGFIFVANSRGNTQCNAAFTSSANQSVVNFTAATSSPYLLHSWNFGDGRVGYGSNIAHTYAAPGQYTVKHVVVDSFNTCRDSISQLTVVSFTETCAANFYVVTDSMINGRFTFYANTTPGPQSIQSYLWKIDGGTVSSTASFTTALAPGAHTICLSITTLAGCSSNTCQTVNVWPRCSGNASFTHTASSADPRQITFSASPNQPGMQYAWSFGDGSSSNLKNVVHTFSQGGNYSVRLSVYDTVASCYDTVRQTVTVNGLPSNICTASFVYSHDSTHPAQFAFTATSNQTITTQSWTIGKLSDTLHSIQINGNNPAYAFSDTGRYIVCVTITTNTGCRTSYCNMVTVSSLLSARQSEIISSYPNPAAGSVRLGVYLEQEKKLIINIYNLSGTIVYSTQKQGTAGNNDISIPIQNLKKGQYFVEIQYGDQRKRSIFQKL